ncbi:MAG: flavin reductase [Cellvibrionaceae bacterium]|nr:flavin reductase [Cellvibrionaceae bacterium]
MYRASGTPVLEDSLVSFDCHLEKTQEVGTHDIFICRVVAIAKTEQEQGLICFKRTYHPVGQMTVA